MMRFFLCGILFFGILETVLAGYVPRAFMGEFTQSKKSINSKDLKTTISLKYQARGNVYMKSSGLDDEKIYVCNPEKIWIYTPPFLEGEKGEVKIGNASNQCLSKVFDKLDQGLVSNSDYKVKKINDLTYLLDFSQANEKLLGFYKFELVFEDKAANFSQLKLMRMYTRNDKNPTVLTKKKLTILKGFDKSTFQFDPPKNTNIDYI